jgi:hypothetical protein
MEEDEQQQQQQQQQQQDRLLKYVVSKSEYVVSNGVIKKKWTLNQ